MAKKKNIINVVTATHDVIFGTTYKTTPVVVEEQSDISNKYERALAGATRTKTTVAQRAYRTHKK